MRITRLSLTNFRGFERLELDLDRPVTVLVGVNGSGKTSVLRAICAAAHAAQHQFEASSDDLRVALDERDVRVGARESAVTGRVQQGQWDHSFRLEHIDGSGWGLRAIPHSPSGPNGKRPFAFFVGTDRYLLHASVQLNLSAIDDLGLTASVPGYARFLAWFKEREDAENARRVTARDFDLQDPQLRAVREAVAAVMPGYERLRIERDPTPAMVATKDGTELRLDQLSDGERNLIALVGDLARRMVLADPAAESPRETEGLVLIDELEQHLHPAWQRRVIPALRRAFPKTQLVVTTHSPQVISSVPESAVIVLDGSAAHAIASATKGRDTNAILREVFGVTERPEDVREEITAIASLIDDAQLSVARARLAALADALSERDEEVLRLRTKLDFAEVGL